MAVAPADELAEFGDLHAAGGQVLHQLIQQQVIQQISSGRIGPGDEVPSVRAMAKQLGVASATVQRAYRELQQRGYVVPRRGRGHIVADFTLGAVSLDEQKRLAGLLDRSIRDAFAMGYSPGAVRNALLVLTDDLAPSANDLPAVLFVARTPEIAAEYEPYLRSTVGDVCTVSTALLDELEVSLRASVAVGSPAPLLITLIPSLDVVRRIAGPLGVDALGMVIELNPASQDSLLGMDHSLPLLVVAEGPFVAPTVAIVRQYVGEQRLIVSMALSDVGIVDAVRGPSVVISSASALPHLRALTNGERALIELRYQPTDATLRRLRRVLEYRTAQPALSRPAR